MSGTVSSSTAEVARARARAYRVCLSMITLYLNLHPVFELSLIVRPPSLKRLKRGFFPSISRMGVRNFVFKNHLNQSAECPAALRRAREKLREIKAKI